MRIGNLLRTSCPIFSFEFFPPKSQAAEARLYQTLSELRALDPAFVSVTYGAGGSTRDKTIELTRRIKRELGIEAMAHLTCVGASRDEIDGVLDALHAGEVENLLLLRGDAPRDGGPFKPVPGGFAYASELTEHVQRRGTFCLGGACYPEGHLEAPSAEVDLENLKRKVDAGAEFLITQIFFDNRVYFDFVDRARARGIQVPIIPGIMPIQSVEQIKRFTKLCGASIPADLLKALEARAEEPERVHELGIVHATIQCLGLIQGGAPGVHFYTLNQSTATREIVTAIRMNARL
ncbi:MAG: methylenetetrahydrofolate reductase [NAD(P)H] [Deltaproteobacteria bacterium]|nr:methylenetetrahydrofolate reductase [NAD(P)H] [Deltaproteobacteria bacterium]